MIFVDEAVEQGVQAEVLMRIEHAEDMAGFEFEVTSGFRVDDFGCHGVGQAVDIRCGDSSKRYEIVKALLFAGFSRIGVYDKHVHADTCEDTMPRGVLWLGISR